MVTAGNTPVAGDLECKDVQKAKIDESLADSQLSQALLNVVKPNKQVQELARGSRSIVPTPTKPTMGRLAQGQCGKEAWTGGKPLPDWLNLDPQASQIPIATQMQSNSSKAATALLKQSKGIFTEESLKFRHKDNLDYFLQRIKAHFV